MQRLIMLVLAVAALVACSDTSMQRSSAPGPTGTPASVRSDPMVNSGQSDSPTTGSASNAASGSQVTPSR